MIKILRITALLEGLSFLLLLGIAMPLKYMFGKPEMVQLVGMAHGVLFIAYIILVLIVRELVKWNFKQTALALVASVLPFGTFYADKKLFKSA
jgi:integral membrane protein